FLREMSYVRVSRCSLAEEANFDFATSRCQVPFHSLAFGAAAFALCGMASARLPRISTNFECLFMAFLLFQDHRPPPRLRAVTKRYTPVGNGNNAVFLSWPALRNVRVPPTADTCHLPAVTRREVHPQASLLQRNDSRANAFVLSV